MVTKKGRPAVNVIDPKSLTEVERAQLRAKAQEQVVKEVKDRTAEAVYRQILDEERRALDPQEETKYIQLDLAGHSDRITIDGTIYFHGNQYAVPLSVYNVLRETVANGWKHEDEVGGANRDQYRKPREIRISPRTQGMAPSVLLGGR